MTLCWEDNDKEIWKRVDVHIVSCLYETDFISPSVFLFPHVGEGSSGDHERSLEMNSMDQVCVEMNGKRRRRRLKKR